MKSDLITKQSEKVPFPDITPNGYKVSQEAQEFIRECLCINPEKRLSAAEAYSHKYFKK
jgi:serine/threonine protein kinase